MLTLDIETDSKQTVIWCCCCEDVDTGEMYTFTSPDGLQQLIDSHDKIVMHNGIAFDAYWLRMLWDIRIMPSKAVDTLIMSRLLNPTLQGGHSLRAWGERLGENKLDFEDYDGGLSEEMVQYCQKDVRVTTALFRVLQDSFKEWKDAGQSIALEHQVAIEMAKQERHGFKLDVSEAQILYAQLSDRMGVIEDQMQSVFEPIVEERWSEKTGKRLKDKVTVFNPGSRKQIAQRLQQLGWKPQKHTEKGSVVVDETTLEDVDIPEAKLIAEYLMIQKRVGLLDSWLKHAHPDTGRVHGGVITNGAVTGRMTHHSPNLGQVPSVNKPYGEECRKLWTVDTGNVLVGTDLSGIELRCLAHYMKDDEWTEELLNGDIHQKNADAAGITRPQAKTLIYATLYGAGPTKIGSIVGGGAREGSQVLENFYRNTPALSRLMEKVKKVANKGYVPGLDGRRILVRSEHAALNSLLQGCGAIIAKQWCIEAHKEFKKQRLSVQQVAFVHDEIQIEAQRPHAETVASIMVASAKKAGEVLGFRCPVDAEAKIGNNWFDTH
jgi:DNA polymerase I-like protein with 3'-5' exonuclease and polymerase domains